MNQTNPESAPRDRQVQQEQQRLDTLDSKADRVVEGEPGRDRTPEQIDRMTNAYIRRVAVLQARIRQVRARIEIQKDMRSPFWPELEKSCNDAEGKLLARLKSIDDKNIVSSIDDFNRAVDGFLESLGAAEQESLKGKENEKRTALSLFQAWATGTPLEKADLRGFAEKASTVYGEPQLRLIAARVELFARVGRPIDTAQLVRQLGMGAIPPRPTPEQAREVTNAILLLEPEQGLRAQLEVLYSRVAASQQEIAELQAFIEAEKATLDRETRNEADEKAVAIFVKNIRETRAKIEKRQQAMGQVYAQVFQLESALAVFDSASARMEGRLEEADRVYFKLFERYGADLGKMDPDLWQRVQKASADLKARGELTAFEQKLLAGDTQDAVKIAAERQRKSVDSDYLAQAKGPKNSLDLDALDPDRTFRRGSDRSGKGAFDTGLLEKARPANEDLQRGKALLLAQNGKNGWIIMKQPSKSDTTDMTFVIRSGAGADMVTGELSYMPFLGWQYRELAPRPEQKPTLVTEYRYGPQRPGGAPMNQLLAGLGAIQTEEATKLQKEQEDANRSVPELGRGEKPLEQPNYLGAGRVSASFTLEPYEPVGTYDGKEVSVTLSKPGSYDPVRLNRLVVGKEKYLVQVDPGALARMRMCPPGMTVALRREPAQANLSPVTEGIDPSRRGLTPARVYRQQVLAADTLTADDIAFVALGRTVEEMRACEEKGLTILKKRGGEVVALRMWDNADAKSDLPRFDTTVRVRKGTIVVEYRFNSTYGSWECREIERDGVNFDEAGGMRPRPREYYPAGIKYGKSQDAARQEFDQIADELDGLEQQTGPGTGLRVVEGKAFNQEPRVVPVAGVEKAAIEDSRDVLRVIDRDPSVKTVAEKAGAMQASLSTIDRLYKAGKDGKKREALVGFMREEAGKVRAVLTDASLKQDIATAKQRLLELKRINTGVNKTMTDAEIDRRIKALDDMVALVEKQDLLKFCDHIIDKSEYDVDGFWSWLEKNIATVLSIAVVVLAIVVTVFTFGVTSPVVIAAVSASAGVLTSEVVSEVLYQNAQGDEDVASGKATFRRRSRTGGYVAAKIEGTKLFNPETGEYEEPDILRQVVSPLQQQFIESFATTLAFAGAGTAIGKGLTSMANSKLLQQVAARSPIVNRVFAYFNSVQQHAPQAKGTMKEFLKAWCIETAEEVGEETVQGVVGDWAVLAIMAQRNFRPKLPARPADLAKSKGGPRFLGEFTLETKGDPAAVASEVKALKMEGAEVTVRPDGGLDVSLDGRTFVLRPDVAAQVLVDGSAAPALDGDAIAVEPGVPPRSLKGLEQAALQPDANPKELVAVMSDPEAKAAFNDLLAEKAGKLGFDRNEVTKELGIDPANPDARGIAVMRAVLEAHLTGGRIEGKVTFGQLKAKDAVLVNATDVEGKPLLTKEQRRFVVERELAGVTDVPVKELQPRNKYLVQRSNGVMEVWVYEGPVMKDGQRVYVFSNPKNPSDFLIFPLARVYDLPPTGSKVKATNQAEYDELVNIVGKNGKYCYWELTGGKQCIIIDGESFTYRGVFDAGNGKEHIFFDGNNKAVSVATLKAKAESAGKEVKSAAAPAPGTPKATPEVPSAELIKGKQYAVKVDGKNEMWTYVETQKTPDGSVVQVFSKNGQIRFFTPIPNGQAVAPRPNVPEQLEKNDDEAKRRLQDRKKRPPDDLRLKAMNKQIPNQVEEEYRVLGDELGVPVNPQNLSEIEQRLQKGDFAERLQGLNQSEANQQAMEIIQRIKRIKTLEADLTAVKAELARRGITPPPDDILPGKGRPPEYADANNALKAAKVDVGVDSLLPPLQGSLRQAWQTDGVLVQNAYVGDAADADTTRTAARGPDVAVTDRFKKDMQVVTNPSVGKLREGESLEVVQLGPEVFDNNTQRYVRVLKYEYSSRAFQSPSGGRLVPSTSISVLLPVDQANAVFASLQANPTQMRAYFVAAASRIPNIQRQTALLNYDKNTRNTAVFAEAKKGSGQFSGGEVGVRCYTDDGRSGWKDATAKEADLDRFQVRSEPNKQAVWVDLPIRASSVDGNQMPLREQLLAKTDTGVAWTPKAGGKVRLEVSPGKYEIFEIFESNGKMVIQVGRNKLSVVDVVRLGKATPVIDAKPIEELYDKSLVPGWKPVPGNYVFADGGVACEIVDYNGAPYVQLTRTSLEPLYDLLREKQVEPAPRPPSAPPPIPKR